MIDDAVDLVIQYKETCRKPWTKDKRQQASRATQNAPLESDDSESDEEDVTSHVARVANQKNTNPSTSKKMSQPVHGSTDEKVMTPVQTQMKEFEELKQEVA